jgi:two-component system response regulator RegA
MLPASDQASESVLVVDDDEAFRTRLARGLERRGFLVQQAADPQQALALARVESPEWALVDLRLGESHGLHLIRDLHALDPSTRILLVTGYGSMATAVDAMRLGASHVVAKPIDVDGIVAAMHRVTQPVLDPSVAWSPPTLDQVEWEHIQRVLSDCGQNISEAARRLGLHRRSLQRKLFKFAPPQP